MGDNSIYYVTVTNLRESDSTFYISGDADKFGKINNVNTPCLNAEMYFDNEISKNEKANQNYKKGMLIGSIEFILGDRSEDFDSILYISKWHLRYGSEENVCLHVFCGEELFQNLRKAISDNLEIRLAFKIGEWEVRETEDCIDSVNRTKVLDVEIKNPIYTEEYYEVKRVRHVENHLLTEFCGGRSEGQIPAICKEISEAFSNSKIFSKREEIYELIIPIIDHIRFTPENNKSDLRKKIERSEDEDLRNLYWKVGDDFYKLLEKISEVEKKNQVLKEYNFFWEHIKAESIFEDGYKWNGEQLTVIAEDYLKIPYINSPTLNTILVDGILLKNIADKWKFLQFNGLISSEAILSIKSGYYNISFFNKNKSAIQVIKANLIDSTAYFFGILITGLFIWFLASLLSGNNELAQYVVFGALFSAFFIVSAINKITTVEPIKENNEKLNFYLLRDMCNIHTQSKYMNADLLKTLMYDLEKRGVLFSNYIYDLLRRS